MRMIHLQIIFAFHLRMITGCKNEPMYLLSNELILDSNNFCDSLQPALC